jgi:hypothetical protein
VERDELLALVIRSDTSDTDVSPIVTFPRVLRKTDPGSC